MAGRYTGSYLDRSDGWRAVAVLTDIGQALLVVRTPAANYACGAATARLASSHLALEGNSYDASISTRPYRVQYTGYLPVPMRYSLQEIDKHVVVATTVAVDRDVALDWFSEKLRLMLTFEGVCGRRLSS